MMRALPTQPRQPAGQILRHGMIGGLVAGLVFIVAEMIMNAALGKPFFGPPRLISSIVLGKAALMPTYPAAKAIIIGSIIHFILAMIFGVITLALFEAARAVVPRLATFPAMVLFYGAVAGCALWVIDFLIIAPAAFPQFTKVNQFWNGFIAHTVFFGLVLGGYLVMMVIRPDVRTRAGMRSSGLRSPASQAGEERTR